MRLKSVHHGITPKQVQDKTGFELLMPDKVPETEAPTAEQVRILREKVDPKSMRKLEFRGSETKV